LTPTARATLKKCSLALFRKRLSEIRGTYFGRQEIEVRLALDRIVQKLDIMKKRIKVFLDINRGRINTIEKTTKGGDKSWRR
jgi:hypothetical protein